MKKVHYTHPPSKPSGPELLLRNPYRIYLLSFMDVNAETAELDFVVIDEDDNEDVYEDILDLSAPVGRITIRKKWS